MKMLSSVLFLGLGLGFVFFGCVQDSKKKSHSHETAVNNCSLDNNTFIKFYNDSTLESVNVITDSYEVLYDSIIAESLGSKGYGMIELQSIEFNQNKSLRKVILNFDENNSLFYFKDSLGNVTFDLSPNFEYTDKSKYSSEATGLK